MEQGEEPTEALARELWEELRIRAVIGREITRYQYAYGEQPAIQLIFYEVAEYSGEPDNQIYRGVAWVTRHDLPHRDFLEGDTQIVNRLTDLESA